ncbi:MAG TPA: nuclear transport factor 2 family protein [Pyrinomonadaceae bacterium]
MTQPLIALAALAVALFLPPSRARAQERKLADARRPGRTVESILRLEKEIMAHIRAKDARALERLLTADFVYRTPGAELGRADFLKGIAAVPGRITSVEGEGLRVSVYGETAVLTGVQRARVRADDDSEREGASAFTDVFVKQKGRWRLALAYGVELPSPTTRQQ